MKQCYDYFAPRTPGKPCAPYSHHRKGYLHYALEARAASASPDCFEKLLSLSFKSCPCIIMIQKQLYYLLFGLLLEFHFKSFSRGTM